MTTYTALTKTRDRASAEALAEAVEGLELDTTGVGIFEIEDGSGLWEVAAYFEEEPDDIALTLLATAHGATGFVISQVPDVDWVAHVKRELAPVEAGRFFVYGSHDADRVPEGRTALLIEAAMAFGTGHHGTTLGCLKALDKMVEAGGAKHNVLDVGCGTAVLAMAAATQWPEVVLASDIDAVAVEVAEANVAANDLGGRVEVVEAPGFDHTEIAARAPFDLVFANILKGPLIALVGDMETNIAPGGHAILSGILNEQADEVVAHYLAHGFNLESRDVIGDWTTLVLARTQEI